ncbi:unnamed protein product [Moneuplotes crassus]|uniref:Uncharacterized protein n=1 Tax=Euplotes crassus TaxID=5936 RepID=A0AAD1X6V9_EUPCR|nr:unnamed protein product [Moneuplotes crassus]
MDMNGSTHRTTLEHDSNVTRKTIAFFKTALLRICYRSFRKFVKSYKDSNGKKFCRDKECDYVKINKVVTKPKMRIYMKPLNKKFVPSAFSRTSNKKFFITRKFKGKPGEEWKHKKMHLGLSLLPSTKSTSEIEKASKEVSSSKDSSSEAKTSHRLLRFENKKLRDKKIIRMNKVIKKRDFKKEESISSIKEFKICVLPPIRKQRK